MPSAGRAASNQQGEGGKMPHWGLKNQQMLLALGYFHPLFPHLLVVVAFLADSYPQESFLKLNS